MNCFCRVPFPRLVATLSAAFALLLGPLASSLHGTPTATIVRIEEDWTLTVSTPDTNSNSPQVTCAMSPVADDEGSYMSFELNHQSQPGYDSGGLHLHAWNGEYLLQSAHSSDRDVMRTSSEVVRWTQSLSVANGQLTYEINNGSSQTWGAFGTGDLKVTVATGLTDLNGYRVNYSLHSSGVGYGANRVGSLELKTVRYFLDTGDVVEVQVNHDVLGNGN